MPVSPGIADTGQRGDAESASGDGTAIAILKNLRTRLTTLVSLLPTALGVLGGLKTEPVAPATATKSSVANSVTSVTLLAANAARKGATVYNDDSSASLKVSLGATASASSFTVDVIARGYYEVPYGYTGIIDGIASAATGNARITELA